MDMRSQCRLENVDIEVEISDGDDTYIGTITNMSHLGLVVEALPTDINHDAATFYLNIQDVHTVYRLRAIPRWVETSRGLKKLGLRIFDKPIRWNDYVDSLELL